MNVGIVSHLYPTPKHPEAGGFIRDQLRYLSDRVNLKLYSPLINRFWFDGGTFDSIPSFPAIRHRLPMCPTRMLQRFNPSLMAYFMRRRTCGIFDDCDVVHAHFAFPVGGAVVRVFAGKKPILVTAHGSDIHDFAYRPELRDAIRNDLIKTEGIIAVSMSLADMIKELGVTVPVHIIPNGIDTDVFTPGSKADAAKLLGLEPNRPRLLFAGHFKPVKNIPQLIRILPEIKKEIADCELVLIGDTPGNKIAAMLKTQVNTIGMNDSVRFVPPVPHEALRDWYRASDVFVLPSRNEGFGLVLAESLACGRPVVATRCGGPESIIVPGTGQLVPHDDDEAMICAIKEVFTGKDIFVSEKLAESVQKRYSFTSVTNKIVEVYSAVVTSSSNV